MALLPSLFDDEEDVVDLPTNVWREVPSALFNSWNDDRQLAYCAARDENAALYADNMDDAMFHQRRSQMYKEMITCRTPSMTRLSAEM